MADTKSVTIRTRKFMTNRLLSRKQFVSFDHILSFFHRIFLSMFYYWTGIDWYLCSFRGRSSTSCTPEEQMCQRCYLFPSSWSEIRAFFSCHTLIIIIQSLLILLLLFEGWFEGEARDNIRCEGFTKDFRVPIPHTFWRWEIIWFRFDIWQYWKREEVWAQVQAH